MLGGSENFWEGSGIRLACCGARKRAKPHGGTVLAENHAATARCAGPGLEGETTGTVPLFHSDPHRVGLSGEPRPLLCPGLLSVVLIFRYRVVGEPIYSAHHT